MNTDLTPNLILSSSRSLSNVLLTPIALAVLCLTGCSQPPECPYTQTQPAVASAGCLALTPKGLLVVETHKGGVSVPGGKSLPDEAPRCTAQRETWEETGLVLAVGELAAVFDTGFHLFHCQHTTDSGVINPPPRFEIKAAYYLPAAEFDTTQWRFADQGRDLLPLISQVNGSDQIHTGETIPQQASTENNQEKSNNAIVPARLSTLDQPVSEKHP